jgi:hypothetical protein
LKGETWWRKTNHCCLAGDLSCESLLFLRGSFGGLCQKDVIDQSCPSENPRWLQTTTERIAQSKGRYKMEAGMPSFLPAFSCGLK